MSNMNFNCDVCGREVQGCTFVNGMKFCAKCYQETFGETEKDRKITDLQSQLAEKKKEINDWKQRFNSSEERCKTFLTNGAKALELKNQDKISFAVEQLEKVKDYAQHIQGGLINFINNQIEELKKEMKQDGLF